MRRVLWLDSFALAVAVPAGVGVAMALEQPALIVVLMGMVTGCMGGLIRDVVVNEVPLVLRQGELYVSAAFAGALLAVALRAFDLPLWGVLAGCGALTWTLRAGSLHFGWSLPVYKTRPPRS